MKHFNKVCEYGFVHVTCGPCDGPKEEIEIKCDRKKEHSKKFADEVKTGRRVHDALLRLVEERFWFWKRSAQAELVNAIEQTLIESTRKES